MIGSGNVDPSVLAKVKTWAPYVDAKLGFRNHWYPVAFSTDVAEGKPVRFLLLGERVLVNRIDGQLYCVKDRCLHRGVSLAERGDRIECRTKDTITCWYHGWTYQWADGKLCDILTHPGSALIGKHAIRTYPIQEAKGLVFIFLGDIDAPPLVTDTPPEFLDGEVAIRGICRIVNSNWRLGLENGFDPAHVYIHKDSILVGANDVALPLGFAPGDQQLYRTVEDDSEGGRKGVYDLLGERSVPVFEGRIHGELVREGHYGKTRLANDISIWLPGVLRVNPWPNPDMRQYEWYVPRDANSHYYFQLLGKACHRDQEKVEFERSFEAKWRYLALEGFNNDDIWAREAQNEFYEDDLGWINEMLFEPDHCIVAWRKLASKFNRGIQSKAHVKA